MARGARKEKTDGPRYLKVAAVPSRSAKAAVVTEAAVKKVSILLPPLRKKALLAVFRELFEEVVVPILRAPDPPEVTQILDAREERAAAALRFIWTVMAEYEHVLHDHLLREQFAKYLAPRRTHKPPRISKLAKAAHDDAFALILASRTRSKPLRNSDAALPEPLSRRITRAVIDVEVLSLAVMAAMTRAQKVRNIDLLEGIIFTLFNAAVFLYAFMGEAVSIAETPRDAERRLVHEFDSSTFHFTLKEGVDVDVTRDGELFVATLHVVPHTGVGATPEAAITSLADHLTATWLDLVSVSEDALSLDAVAAKWRLVALVENAEPK